MCVCVPLHAARHHAPTNRRTHSRSVKIREALAPPMQVFESYECDSFTCWVIGDRREKGAKEEEVREREGRARQPTARSRVESNSLWAAALPAGPPARPHTRTPARLYAAISR